MGRDDLVALHVEKYDAGSNGRRCESEKKCTVLNLRRRSTLLPDVPLPNNLLQVFGGTKRYTEVKPFVQQFQQRLPFAMRIKQLDKLKLPTWSKEKKRPRAWKVSNITEKSYPRLSSDAPPLLVRMPSSSRPRREGRPVWKIDVPPEDQPERVSAKSTAQTEVGQFFSNAEETQSQSKQLPNEEDGVRSSLVSIHLGGDHLGLLHDHRWQRGPDEHKGQALDTFCYHGAARSPIPRCLSARQVLAPPFIALPANRTLPPSEEVGNRLCTPSPAAWGQMQAMPRSDDSDVVNRSMVPPEVLNINLKIDTHNANRVMEDIIQRYWRHAVGLPVGNGRPLTLAVTKPELKKGSGSFSKKLAAFTGFLMAVWLLLLGGFFGYYGTFQKTASSAFFGSPEHLSVGVPGCLSVVFMYETAKRRLFGATSKSLDN